MENTKDTIMKTNQDKKVHKIKDKLFKEMYNEAKWIYTYVKKYRLAIFFYIILYTAGSISGIGSSLASKYLIDSLTSDNTKHAKVVIMFFVGFGLFGIILNGITSRITAKINIRINNEIRSNIYDSILITDSESLSSFHSGDLLNRINGDVNVVVDSVTGWIPGLVKSLIQFAFAFFIILYFDPVMAFLALSSSPFALVVSKILTTKMRLHNGKMREASSVMMSFHEESFINLLFIKAFNLTNIFSEKHKKIQDQYKEVSLEYNKFSVITNIFMSLTGLIVSYICFGWGVYSLWKGDISFGTMILFLQLSGTLSASMSSLISLVPKAVSATTSAGRIMAFTTLAKENKADINTETLNKAIKEGVSVEMNGVSFSYRNGTKIFDNINFEVKAGEIVAIIGASGEGKTTLLKILLGMLNISSGSSVIKTNNESIDVSPDTRYLLSYVPQNNTLFTGTIADNMRYIKPDVNSEDIIDALKTADAFDFVLDLPDGINTNVQEMGSNLSEGQKQRLSIARALLSKAPLILLDEATSALDMMTERRVLENIMCIKENTTCIITTHRPTVLSVCDRVYMINDKKITELVRGEIDNLMRELA